MEEQTHYYIIKVLNLAGEWYTNALIQNRFDAIQVAKLYRDQLGYGVQIWYEGKDMSFLLNAKTIEIEREKDDYLDGLYRTVEMCDLTIQNRAKFNPDVVASAVRIKHETEERIKLRELTSKE